MVQRVSVRCVEHNLGGRQRWENCRSKQFRPYEYAEGGFFMDTVTRLLFVL
jgi:hypothetical protein